MSVKTIPDTQTLVEWHRLAAEGDPVAQNSLGVAYLKGWNVPICLETAAYWFSCAASQGNLKGRFNYGVRLIAGGGVSRDVAKGIELISGCANQEHPPAMSYIGTCLIIGLHGMTIDIDTGARLIRQAAEMGDHVSEYSYSSLLETSDAARDVAASTIWLVKAAEGGIADAQFKLGYKYEYGIGLEISQDRAIHWYRCAAEQGHGSAQLNLATLLVLSKETLAEAVLWYQLAAEANQGEALVSLGIMYCKGNEIIPQDGEKGIEYLNRAAKLGNKPAQALVSELHSRTYEDAGIQAPDTYQKQINSAMDAQGCYTLAVNMYNSSKGSLNYDEFAYWMQLSAEQGHTEAQFQLSSLYLDGLGVERNHAEAVRWMKKAADSGHPQAIKTMNALGVS